MAEMGRVASMFLSQRRRLNPNVEDMQRVVERMAAAKWITGTNIVAPENIVLSFTRRGKDRMRRIRKSLRTHAHHACMPPWMCTYDPKSHPPMSFEARINVEFEIKRYLDELKSPLSPGEEDSLMALLLFYAREEKDLLTGSAPSTTFAVPGFELEKPPDIKLNDFQVYMQGAVDRLARAKWIRGESVVTDSSTRVTFTVEGRKQMQEIRSVLRDIDAMYAKTPSGKMIKGEPNMSPEDYMNERFMVDLSHIFAELEPHPWSDGEQLMFSQLFWYYSRTLKDPLAKGPATVEFPIPGLSVKVGPDTKGKKWPKHWER